MDHLGVRLPTHSIGVAGDLLQRRQGDRTERSAGARARQDPRGLEMSRAGLGPTDQVESAIGLGGEARAQREGAPQPPGGGEEGACIALFELQLQFPEVGRTPEVRHLARVEAGLHRAARLAHHQ